ncbi:CIS tube protein [Micromonospora sp. LZ34]
MALNLDPRLVAFDAQLERGAIMRLDPAGTASSASGGRSGGSSPAGSPASQASPALSGKVLYFQYNPETISRTRTGKWEPRKKRRGLTVETPQAVRQRSGQGSSALLAESETISLKVVFDATEALLARRIDAERTDGVLPQLAFLEVLSTGKEGNAANQDRETVQPVRPDELLLVLGRRRLFPVVLTSMTITESKFLPTLVPLRADADLKFTVLEPDESAYSGTISTAYARLLSGRATLSSAAAAEDAVVSAIDRELTRNPFQAPKQVTA